MQGYPSLVKGAGLRTLLRRHSGVRIAPLALDFLLFNIVMTWKSSGRAKKDIINVMTFLARQVEMYRQDFRNSDSHQCRIVRICEPKAIVS